jgi:hypothetical protein
MQDLWADLVSPCLDLLASTLAPDFPRTTGALRGKENPKGERKESSGNHSMLIRSLCVGIPSPGPKPSQEFGQGGNGLNLAKEPAGTCLKKGFMRSTRNG